MPREFGGHSPLGKALNQQGSKQEGIYAGKVTFTTGEIIARAVYDPTTKSYKEPDSEKQVGVYRFKVKLANGKKTGFIQLSGTFEELNAKYGEPYKLMGRKCQLMYTGPSSSGANILSIEDSKSDPLAIETANKLALKGCAFAPPGGAMV